FYASGPDASRFAALKDFGLDIRVLGGPMSAASALKMSYAGITKGTQALGAVMMLAATRGGTAGALLAGLQGSQPQMLAWLKRSLALMPPKAYRWIAEMHEIADFVGEDRRGTNFISAPRISTSRSRATSRATRQKFQRSRRS